MVYGRKNTAIRKSAATRYSVQAAKPGTRFVRCEIIITTPCPPAQEDISPPTFCSTWRIVNVPGMGTFQNCESKCKFTRNETDTQGAHCPHSIGRKVSRLKSGSDNPLRFQEIESHQRRTVHAIGNLPAMM